MKCEIVTYVGGEIKIEIITETDAEYQLLKAFWKARGYDRGKGRTVTPDGMSTGFFIPLAKIERHADGTNK